MKTFKLIGVALLTVLMCVGFSSCSKSDDDNGGSSSNPLVGTWELSDEDITPQWSLKLMAAIAKLNIIEQQIIYRGLIKEHIKFFL